jgi:hypothetical protein
MPFAKLDSGIIRSSIWSEPLATRVVWITMLAMKDESGFVATSRSGLLRACNVTETDFNTAISCLESPDTDSRTSDHQGKRIAKIEGGWVILNHEKYRLHDDMQRERTRERVRRFRDKARDVTGGNVTNTLPSVSASVSVSVSEDRGCKGEGKRFVEPGIEEITEYITAKEYSVDPVKFYAYYTSNGWKVGKNPMKNWKAAIVKWHCDSKEDKRG